METTLTVLPAQRQMLQGIVVARWAALGWMAIQLGVALGADEGSSDRLARPAAAFVVLATVAALNGAFTIALRRNTRALSSWRIAAVELVVAFGLYVADGWVFVDGHVFDSQIALASSWPLVAVLSIAVVHGEWAGAAAGACVPVGRMVGTAVSGVPVWTQNHVLSFSSSIAFYCVAGYVAGLIARLLRNVESDNAIRAARDEVSRQLHDGVLQTLALVERRAAVSDPELARAARDSDRELRQWMWGGEPETDRLDVVGAVRQSANVAAARFGLRVTVSGIGGSDDTTAVPAAVVAVLAAATAELVTNVAKHAGVDAAVVFVDAEDSSVTISVRDQGLGIAPGTQERDGLGRSVRGRVEEIGGTVAVSSAPGEGTEVEIRWHR